MYEEIKLALDSTNVLSALIRTLLGESKEAKALAAELTETRNKFTRASVEVLAGAEKIAALQEQVRILRQEMNQIENWNAQAKKYRLQAVGAEKLHFAQIYKPGMNAPKQRHWACAKCFQERKLYILSAAGRSTYRCPNCGHEIAPIIPGGGLAPIDSAYE